MNQIEWCKNRLVQHEEEMKTNDYYLSRLLPLNTQKVVCEGLIGVIGDKKKAK